MGGRQPEGAGRGCHGVGEARAHRPVPLLLGLVVVLCAPLSAAEPAHGETFFFRDRAGVTHFTNVPTDRRFKVLQTARSNFSQIVVRPGVASGDGRALDLRSSGGSGFARYLEPPADIAAMIADAANRYGVEPALVHAVVRAESAFDHLAVSRAGAMGLMQLMPATAELVGVRDAFHPEQNVDGGVYYLRKMLDRFGDNTALALAAYNAGPGAVEAYGGIPPFRETQEYLERVFRFRQEYLRKSIERRIAFAKPAARR
jgi:soluble lytic murein transglycosylase-like protein